MRYLLTFCVLLASVSGAFAADGVIMVRSSHDVVTTADRLEAALTSKGMTVFTRTDHTAGAQKAGLELRPTLLVVFGNPKVGTPLMQCQQTVAIDLPQKALIYQDEAGQVWLAYNDPDYLDTRHAIGPCGEQGVKKVAAALANFSRMATKP